MAISTPVARQLCNKTEFKLFTESSSKNVKALGARSLRTRLSRVRKLQDKYRQLASRQEREARGKQKPQGRHPAKGSAATRKKEQLFVETRKRFENQLAKLEAAEKENAKKKMVAKRPTKKSARKKAKSTVAGKKAVKTAKKRPVTPAARTKKAKARAPESAEKAKAKSTKAKLTASGNLNRQKHRSAANKRRQARRDAG